LFEIFAHTVLPLLIRTWPVRKLSALPLNAGWGDFDVLLDFGVDLPTGDFHKLGTPLLTNVTFQYKLLNVLWPQLEVNYTYWPNGPNRGKNQVFLLPGILLGPIPLHKRLAWSLGVGYQFAVSHAHPQYENNWIFDFRINF
jgi:hypothetical protein